jgi:hypothetical protein
MAFSISSFTTEAGLSITSPAAMTCEMDSGNTSIFLGIIISKVEGCT